MSVVFGSTTGTWVDRTTNLPSLSGFSLMGWIFPTSIAAGDKIAFSFGNLGSFADYEFFLSGAALAIWNGSAQANGSNLVANVWRHIALTVNGTTGSNALGYLDGVLNITATARAVSAGSMRYGNNGGLEPLLGRMAAIKVYNAVLTQAELAQEMWTYVPQRTAGLNDWRPFLSVADLVDYSGAGNASTTGATPTTADGPPIQWRARKRRMVYIPAGGGGGTSVDVTPGAGAIVFAGFAPKAESTTDVRTPSFGAVVFQGFAPTVETPRALVPPAGAIVFAGNAPRFDATTDVRTPPAGLVTFQGFAPTVETPRAMVPPAGAVVFAGFAPKIDITTDIRIPPAGAVVFGGLAPTVQTSNSTIITPPAGAVVFQGFAPTVETPRALVPPAGAVVFAGFAPKAVATTDIRTPPAGAVVFGGFAPTIQIGNQIALVPGSGAAAFNGFAPTVFASANKFLTPGAGSVVFTGFAPSMPTTVTVIPGSGAISWRGFRPTVFAINADVVRRPRDIRMQPFWHAVRKRLASTRMIQILGKEGRIYIPSQPIPDREVEQRDMPWTRIIIQQVQGLTTLRPDLPGQPRLVPFQVKVETVDFQAVGYDIQIPLDAAHAEVFELLDNWGPGVVTYGGVSVLVSLPVYRQYPPDPTPLLDDALSLWVRSAEYRTQLAPVP